MKKQQSKTVESDINKKGGENRQEKGRPLKLGDIIRDLNNALVNLPKNKEVKWKKYRINQ